MNASEFSVRKLAAQVAAGSLSAEQVAHAALARAQAYAVVQPQAWISRVPDDLVLQRARAIDAQLAAGEVLPLAGVPFVVKDNIDAAGLPTTAACPEFAYLPAESATVVALLERAGAVLLGKANLDQFATGLSGARSPYGVPHCVFNRDYVSGGSSSGSAVLVAAGVASFSLGTDTAGSGRVPAAINGLVGFKPTRGRWSNAGVVPACRSLDCVTVFAHDTHDALYVDRILAQFDSADPWSRAVPAPAENADLIPRRPVLLGVAARSTLDFSGDGESAALYDAALDKLKHSGVELVEIDVQPLLAVAQLLYSGPWVAERLEVSEALLKSQPGAFHPVVRGILQEARLVSAADAFRGMHALQSYQVLTKALWRDIDLLCLPTAPTIFGVAEMLADPVRLNSILGRYTNFVNLLDMSALAVPAGFRANGTGFGITLIGPAWSEPALFATASAYEALLGFTPPAPVAEARAQTVELAVVGAHLRDQPLHWQLSSRGAEFIALTQTAPSYRLYAMAGQQPAKPALVHAGTEPGAAIEVEVYRLSVEAFGSFVNDVPAPLAIGSVQLADGRTVKGFVSEPRALVGALEITGFGGWRAWRKQQVTA